MQAVGRMNGKSEWRYFIAAMLLVLSQLAASWHVPHEEPDILAKGSDCAICSIVAHVPGDASPTPAALPQPVLASEVFMLPDPLPRVATRIAARSGPRAPPAA